MNLGKQPSGLGAFLAVRSQPIQGMTLVFGALVWIAALGMVFSSVKTVQSRVARSVQLLFVDLPEGAKVSVGDPVFRRTARGLIRIGETTAVVKDEKVGRDRCELAILPNAFAELNASVQVTCWKTPLDAEAAITSLLPVEVWRQATELIKGDWHSKEEAIVYVWRPMILELFSEYLSLVVDDLRAAGRRHEGEVWILAEEHAMELTSQWPVIQERLSPILQKHLNPVLGRLIHLAATDAPKVEIALLLAGGHHADAFHRMLDFLAGYLANMPEEHRLDLLEAIHDTWKAAHEDTVIHRIFLKTWTDVAEDRRLQEVLLAIYREAVADNPRTREFLRKRVLESREVQDRFYDLVEAFGPTASNVVALCLFDEQGATRPEVVSLLRSTSLGRTLTWITIDAPDATAAPLVSESVTSARLGGTRP
ncbi:MAG: hypothetical protein AABZ47_17090 [Planctomycetota bacterium]